MALGMNKHEAVKESLRVNRRPIFLTSLTTTIGFLSLTLNESPLLAQMGNSVAIGVGTAWLLSNSFLPTLISLLPIQPRSVVHLESKFFHKLSD